MGLSWCRSKRTSHQYAKRIAELDTDLNRLQAKRDELAGHLKRLGSMSGDADGTDVSLSIKDVTRKKKLADALYTKAHNELIQAQASQGLGSLLSKTMSSAQKVRAVQGKETTDFDKFLDILDEHDGDQEEHAHVMDELEKAMAESEKRTGETTTEEEEEVMAPAPKISTAPRVPVKAPSVHHDETDDLLQVAGMV